MESQGLVSSAVLAYVLVTPIGSETSGIAGIVHSDIAIVKLVVGAAHAHRPWIFSGEGKGSAHLEVRMDIQAESHADAEIARPIVRSRCRTGDRCRSCADHQPACVHSFHKSPLITPCMALLCDHAVKARIFIRWPANGFGRAVIDPLDSVCRSGNGGVGL